MWIDLIRYGTGQIFLHLFLIKEESGKFDSRPVMLDSKTIWLNCPSWCCTKTSVTGYSVYTVYALVVFYVVWDVKKWDESWVLTCFRKLVIVFCMSVTNSWKSFIEGSVLDCADTLVFIVTWASSNALKNKNDEVN